MNTSFLESPQQQASFLALSNFSKGGDNDGQIKNISNNDISPLLRKRNRGLNAVESPSLVN